MRNLVEYIVKAIVSQPEEVNISEEDDEEGLLIKVEVASEDKGRVIGREGRVAGAIRTLLRVKAAKDNAKVRLQIL